MAETNNVTPDLMPRGAAQAGRDAAVRAPSGDDFSAGRRGMPSDEFVGEARRINPRSPRAALEPERGQVPTKWSQRGRHPLVIFGNAVFTVLIVVAVLGAIVFGVAKYRFEAP